MKTYDVIIIGSGVAGMTAAIYLKRANLDVLIIEKNAPGGQVNHTDEVSNYPGFSTIAGPELASNIYMQLHELKADLVIEEAIDIKDNSDYKEVVTNKSQYKAKKIIIATGRKPKHLGLPNEQRLSGRGISWCAICDGPLYKNKTVAVVGGGNSAMEEASYLATLVDKLYLIHRNDHFRAEAILVDRLNSREHVEFKLFNEVKEYIIEEDKLAKIRIQNNQTGVEEILNVDGIFMCIGYEPNLALIAKLNITNELGYIVVDQSMHTKVNGIYACGDNIQKGVYQIATAIGEGAIAATSIVNDLSKE